MGSLTLPCSEPVMQPYGFAGLWKVFSTGRRTSPCWEGEGLRVAIVARESTHFATLSGEPGHLPLPIEEELQGPGVLHPCSSPPTLLTPCSLLAISPRDGGSHLPGCLLGQSVGTTRALSVSQSWAGLPATPISGAAPELGLGGTSPILAVLRPGLEALHGPTLTAAGECSGCLGPLSDTAGFGRF